MTLVRRAEEARWLPSRHHFALFRLAAFLRLSLHRERTMRNDLALMIDRDQSTAENYLVSSWITLTLTCYFTAGHVAWLPLSFVLAVVALQVPTIVLGLIVWNRNNLGLNSKIYMLLLITASAWLTQSPTWVRFAAWQFLAITVLNAIAAVILFLLRGPVARLEASFAA